MAFGHQQSLIQKVTKSKDFIMLIWGFLHFVLQTLLVGTITVIVLRTACPQSHIWWKFMVPDRIQEEWDDFSYQVTPLYIILG